MDRDEYMQGFLTPERFVNEINTLIESGKQVVAIMNGGTIIHNVKSASFKRETSDAKINIKDFFDDDWWEDFDYARFCDTMSGLSGRWNEDGDEFFCNSASIKNTITIDCDSIIITREWTVIDDEVKMGEPLEFHQFSNNKSRFFMCDKYDDNGEPVNVTYFNIVK